MATIDKPHGSDYGAMDMLCMIRTGKRQWLFTIYMRRKENGRMTTHRMLSVGTDGHRNAP